MIRLPAGRAYGIFFWFVLGGLACSSAANWRVTRLAITDDYGFSSTDDERQMLWTRLKGVADRKMEKLRAYGSPGRYREADYDMISIHRLPTQACMPGGGLIIRGIAKESGMGSEMSRCDLGITVFCMPGKQPSHVSDEIPSKAGWRQRYDVYDVPGRNDLLMIAENELSGCGGGVELFHWHRRDGTIERVWGVWGDEDADDCSYEMLYEGIPRLVIHGVRPNKREGYERALVGLREKLGFPVTIHYCGKPW